MKKFLLMAVIAAVMFGSGSALAVSYSNDFEGDTPGTLPAGWYLATPWGDWAPGPIYATVEAAPAFDGPLSDGNQALEVVWGTDWVSYGASSGEVGYTLTKFPEGCPGRDNGWFHIEFDMWKENWRVWQVSGDNLVWFPPGGIYMQDDPLKPNGMHVGDDVDPLELTDVPESEWIHVDMYFNAVTDYWETTVSYASGSGGGTFSNTRTDDPGVLGQFFFGGWAFKSTMDAEPVPPGGIYDNVVYIDNFSMDVVPEPGTMLLIGFGLLALIGRFFVRKK